MGENPVTVWGEEMSCDTSTSTADPALRAAPEGLKGEGFSLGLCVEDGIYRCQQTLWS